MKCCYQGCSRPPTHSFEMTARSTRGVLARSSILVIACPAHVEAVRQHPDVVALAWRGLNECVATYSLGEIDPASARIVAKWGVGHAPIFPMVDGHLVQQPRSYVPTSHKRRPGRFA